MVCSACMPMTDLFTFILKYFCQIQNTEFTIIFLQHLKDVILLSSDFQLFLMRNHSLFISLFLCVRVCVHACAYLFTTFKISSLMLILVVLLSSLKYGFFVFFQFRVFRSSWFLEFMFLFKFSRKFSHKLLTLTQLLFIYF